MAFWNRDPLAKLRTAIENSPIVSVVFALVTLATLSCVPVSSAGDAPRDRATLARHGPIYVLVEELGDDLKRGGLSIETLQADPELRLRSVGVRVATASDSSALPGSPYLYVHVTGGQASSGGRGLGYAASVKVSLVQFVRLERDPSLSAATPTWSMLETVVGPSVGPIRESVRDLVGRFANAYLAVNPK